jgi:uncharacterized membrane protein
MINPLRFHRQYDHLHSVFGNDWFAQKAETFARFFGTPIFLMIQSGIVGIWIIFNVIGFTFHFDPYPFVFLNLAFSLQAAYAAPLILLAQTRQADRDKALSEADALHREDIAKKYDEQQTVLIKMLEQNTTLTEKIEALTSEVHNSIIVKK